jgi:Fur family ferric uptake transcriptional regulator
MRSSSVTTAIHDTLHQVAPAHLTAAEIYDQIHNRLPAVNPSTVYRALERMAEAGEISVSDMGTGATVYEALQNGLHHHLVCQHCGAVITIPHEEVAAFFHSIESTHQFEISTNHLILFGVCSNCRSKQD